MSAALDALRSELKRFQVSPEFDIFVVPGFLGNDLGGRDPAALQAAMEAAYPVRRAGDAIVPGLVQWVEGSNDALKYRGNELKRTKIWVQRGDPQERGYAYYYYTGVQWEVVPAQTDWARCPEVAELVPRYDSWCRRVGAKLANQAIVTAYRNGDFGIGKHSDKARSIAPSDEEGASLITVVKTGPCARPFELFRGEEKEPFWSEVVQPGTAIIMTLEANLATKHAVPTVEDPGLGSSGSIVFRSISSIVSPAQLEKNRAASLRAKKRARGA